MTHMDYLLEDLHTAQHTTDSNTLTALALYAPHTGVLALAVANPHMPGDILTDLATQERLLEIADDPACPAQTLSVLATNPNPEIAYAATHNPLYAA